MEIAALARLSSRIDPLYLGLSQRHKLKSKSDGSFLLVEGQVASRVKHPGAGPPTGTSFLFINANGTYHRVFRMADQREMISEASWEEIPGDYHQMALTNVCALPSERIDDESTRPGFRCIGIGRSGKSMGESRWLRCHEPHF